MGEGPRSRTDALSPNGRSPPLGPGFRREDGGALGHPSVTAAGKTGGGAGSPIAIAPGPPCGPVPHLPDLGRSTLALTAMYVGCYYTSVMIQAVFFDLYGTLAGFRPDRFEVQSEACAGFGITPEGILRGYAQADAFMSEQNAVRPVRVLPKAERDHFFAEYERRVLRGCGVEVSTEQAGQIWRAVREIPYEMARFDDVLPAMDLLKQQGLTLGLISNMNAPGRQIAEQMGLSPYLDFAVTSGEVGTEKPHPPIFEEALRRARAEAQDAMHVGDQLRSDIEGAANVGISPVLLDRDGNHREFSDYPRIETLMELPGLLAGLAGSGI